MTLPVRAREPLTPSIDTSTVGYWQLVGRNQAGSWRDITVFRGTPTQLGQFGFSDPFGAKQMQITLPQVTPLESPGFGDLDWIYDGAPIDLIWHGDLPLFYPFGSPQLSLAGGIDPTLAGWNSDFRWEGFITSYDPDTDAGVTLSCMGALYQADNYQAVPEYPARPFPYEVAIARQLRGRPHLRTRPLQVCWPETYSTVYFAPPSSTPSYLIPAGVKPLHFWTGLLTRDTGKWEAVLTSYIQTILAGMYTATGRWTIDLATGRHPILLQRTTQATTESTCIVIDAVLGNKMSISVDWSQRLDVVFGQGTSLDSVAYSGMQVSSDGSQTWYEPMAARRQAYPIDHNAWLDTSLMPREVMLQMQAGLDESGARQVAVDHLRRFADPGVTGTITLATDPRMNGMPMSRYLVRAGMQVVVPGMLGLPEGIPMHVTDNTCDLTAGTNTLTVDSKFRDALTVAEVRKRGRDALKIPRMLVAGQYSPPVPDQLFPWNYNHGSGYVPSGKSINCLKLFRGIPQTSVFPWTDWTVQRPPKDAKWRDSYIHIGPTDTHDASNNWAYSAGGPKAPRAGIMVLAAQTATIRLLQIAAYDRNGNVMKVPFHVSFYWSNGVNVKSMPLITDTDRSTSTGMPAGYKVGQYYPFGITAWEKYNTDGTIVNPTVPQATDSAGLIRAYGTYFDKAGFFPGSDPGVGSDAGATGLLVDESTWTIDTTETQQQFDPSSKKGNLTNPLAGRIYAMVYCDAQDAKDVYFLGRIFRVEPGTGSGS